MRVLFCLSMYLFDIIFTSSLFILKSLHKYVYSQYLMYDYGEYGTGLLLKTAGLDTG